MFVSELRARNAPPVSLEASVCLRKMSFTDALHVSASEGQSRVQVQWSTDLVDTDLVETPI